MTVKVGDLVTIKDPCPYAVTIPGTVWVLTKIDMDECDVARWVPTNSKQRTIEQYLTPEYTKKLLHYLGLEGIRHRQERAAIRQSIGAYKESYGILLKYVIPYGGQSNADNIHLLSKE